MADILTDSPVENLPAASGKKRKGRPRKQRIDDAATIAASMASQALPLQAEEVKAAIKEAVTAAVKKPKAADPESVKGIAGLEREVTRAAVKKAVREEIGSDPDAGISRAVRETITGSEAREALTTEHGQSHPFWHLLRTR
jgi:hypothetical protein